MNNAEILQKILSGYKKLTTYHPYPTRGGGEEIYSTDNHNGGKYDEPMKNFINLTIQLGAAVAGRRLDNKTAVRVEVDGLDFPVYFRRFDGYYQICKELNSTRNPAPIPINWNIEN